MHLQTNKIYMYKIADKSLKLIKPLKYDFSKIKKYFFTNLESAHSPDKTDNAIDLQILAEQSSGCESEEQYTLYVHVHHIKK